MKIKKLTIVCLLLSTQLFWSCKQNEPAPPAKEKTLKEQIVNIVWESDQENSKVIKKQTEDSPPYHVFATVAQKYFEFKEDGKFFFKVTKPMEFENKEGSWSINDDGIINIKTTIPVGPLEIKTAKINHLSENKLVLEVSISDGIFLIAFKKKSN